MEPTKSQLIYKNACLSEGIEKLQIENEELRVQNEALALKVKHIKEAMGDLDFYYKAKLAEKEKEIAYMTKQAKKFNNEAQKYFEDAYCNDAIYQDKIDYAVEKLEIVKSTILDYVDIEITRLKDIDEIFDNQIKQVKEGK